MLYGPNILYLKVVNDSNEYKLKPSRPINLHSDISNLSSRPDILFSKTLIMEQANFPIKIWKVPEELDLCLLS